MHGIRGIAGMGGEGSVWLCVRRTPCSGAEVRRMTIRANVGECVHLPIAPKPLWRKAHSPIPRRTNCPQTADLLQNEA